MTNQHTMSKASIEFEHQKNIYIANYDNVRAFFKRPWWNKGQNHLVIPPPPLDSDFKKPVRKAKP